MKTSPHSSKAANAFTLIELLVVVLIILILASLLFPAFSAVRESARKVSARNDEMMIVSSIKNYFVEYQKYPVDPAKSGTNDSYFSAGTPPSWTGATGQPVLIGTNDILFDVLRNNTGNTANATIVASLNPRGVIFMDVPGVKNPSQPISGVIPNTASGAKIGAWYDAWGSQYNVLMNSSYSNSIPNPYTDSPGGAPLSTTVIVWAFGKNGALGGGAPPANTSFSSEPGTSGNLKGSGDVASWSQ